MLSAHPPLPKKQAQKRAHPSMELPALDPVLQELGNDEKTSPLVKFVLHSLILFMKQAAHAQTDVENKLKVFLEQHRVPSAEVGSILSRQASAKEQKHHISGETFSDPLSPRPIDTRMEQEDKKWEEFAKKQIAKLVSAELPLIQQKFLDKLGSLQNPPHPRPKKARKLKNLLQSSSKVMETAENGVEKSMKDAKLPKRTKATPPQTWGVLPNVSDEQKPEATDVNGLRTAVEAVEQMVGGLHKEMARSASEAVSVGSGLQKVEAGLEELRCLCLCVCYPKN